MRALASAEFARALQIARGWTPAQRNVLLLAIHHRVSARQPCPWPAAMARVRREDTAGLAPYPMLLDVLDSMRSGFRAGTHELHEDTGSDKSEIRRVLQRCERNGWVARAGRAWRITDDGLRVLTAWADTPAAEAK